MRGAREAELVMAIVMRLNQLLKKYILEMNFQKNLQSQNGWYRYDVRFAMPVYDEETLVSVVKPHFLFL